MPFCSDERQSKKSFSARFLWKRAWKSVLANILRSPRKNVQSLSRSIGQLVRLIGQVAEQKQAERVEEEDCVGDEHERMVEKWVEETDEKVDGGDDENRKWSLPGDAEKGDRGQTEREEQVEQAIELKLKEGDHEEQQDDEQLDDEEERQNDLECGEEKGGLASGCQNGFE